MSAVRDDAIRRPGSDDAALESWPIRDTGEALCMRRERDRGIPLVVDAKPGKQAPQTLKVRPAVFVRLIERLNRPVVAHQKRSLGGHVYTVQCGGFMVQTRSPEPLRSVDGLAAPMEEESNEIQAETEEKEQVMTSQDEGKPHDAGVVKRTAPLMELESGDGYYVTEWWNTPADPALSVARMRIEPGATSKPYQLHGFTERYLFLSGTGFLEVDGEVHEVGPGDGILIKPGAWRSVTNKGTRDLGWLAICRPRFSRLDPDIDKTKFVRKD